MKDVVEAMARYDLPSEMGGRVTHYPHKPRKLSSLLPCKFDLMIDTVGFPSG